MTEPHSRRTYETLDAIAVCGALVIIGGGIAGLMFAKVPDTNLPIIAGLLGTLLGTIIGGYAGFRWANNSTVRPISATTASTAKGDVNVTAPETKA